MKNTLFIGLILFTLSACSDFLEEYSQDLARVETVADLDELLLGSAYLPVGYYENYGENETYNLFIHFMSDELQQNSESDEGVYSFASLEYGLFGYYTWQPSVGINSKLTSVGSEYDCWKKTYQYINATNIILDELDKVHAANEREALSKIRIEGEACFLRALYYFTLVNLYAKPYEPSRAAATPGVPLKLTSYVEDKNYTLNTLAEVYEQIIEDLNRAERCLKQTEVISVYRAGLTAAYLLTSRVYLYMQDYKNARKYAQYVLDRNNALTDLRNYKGEGNVLTSELPEVIFSMGGNMLSTGIMGAPYDWFYGEYIENARPFYISEDLYHSFDDNDLRKSNYITPSDDYHTYHKVSWENNVHPKAKCSVSDNFLFRSTEAYLILVEAAAFDNDETKARELLTLLLSKRYHTPPAVDESGNELIDLIRAERQRELCLEGHRWYDLRRYTVCEKYRWSKEITHAYTEFAGYDGAVETRIYKLNEFDGAYTLAIPKEVLEFQLDLGKNERPARPVIDRITY